MDLKANIQALVDIYEIITTLYDTAHSHSPIKKRDIIITSYYQKFEQGYYYLKLTS